MTRWCRPHEHARGTGEDDEYFPILTKPHILQVETYWTTFFYTDTPIKLNIKFSSDHSVASSSLILAIAAAGLRPLGQVRVPNWFFTYENTLSRDHDEEVWCEREK